MATCFVIQPFDQGKFDKRYNDIYKPSIEAAGLESYRVDKDPGVLVPIEAIERGIRESAICLADITSDNPNVWYELGFAFAAARPVVMVCSEERTGKKYPFDIQHRSIIPYLADSPSDFETLKRRLTEKLQAILEQDAVLDTLAAQDPMSPVHGLSQPEVLVLAVIAGDVYLPAQATSVMSVKRSAERAGITPMGFNLAVRRLLTKKLVAEEDLWDEHDGETYAGIRLTEAGWSWIDANDTKFVLHRPDRKQKDDDIPF
jgi:hypothetical protein